MAKLTVTQEQVEAQIVNCVIETFSNKTTVCIFTLLNGFVIVESSSCVDPANYDIEIGKEICRKAAIEKIWMLEGYVLQTLISVDQAYKKIAGGII